MHEFHHNWKVKGRQDICPCYILPSIRIMQSSYDSMRQFFALFVGNMEILDVSLLSDELLTLEKSLLCFIPFHWF